VGPAWEVHLERATIPPEPLVGSLIASIYCWYR
jgi:hypothetical protein